MGNDPEVDNPASADHHQMIISHKKAPALLYV